IDGHDAGHTRIAPPGDDQGNCAANGDPTEHHIAEIMDVEKSFDGANKEIGVVLRLRDVRITVTGVIEGVDGEKLRQIRHDLFEKVELRAQRMEQDEVRPHASLDVADLDVLNVGVLDGNGGGPTQRLRRLRGRAERFNDV